MIVDESVDIYTFTHMEYFMCIHVLIYIYIYIYICIREKRQQCLEQSKDSNGMKRES
jgi:hypothetical protein